MLGRLMFGDAIAERRQIDPGEHCFALPEHDRRQGEMQLIDQPGAKILTHRLDATADLHVGFVDSLSRPGGNATGFMMFEYNLSGKWLELLKQIAPDLTRAAVLRDPALTAGIGQFAVIQSMAPSVGVEVSSVDLHDPAEIERAIAAFSRSPNGGLILTASPLSAVRRELIIALAAQHNYLPSISSASMSPPAD
jgi:ABC-type uncharacterized transport system substrate-binding protein